MFAKTQISHALKFSPSHLHNALNHHLYITSSPDLSFSVLCYDDVLCYLSNVIGHGSIEEIEVNLERYFSYDQLNQAYENLKNALHYSLSTANFNLVDHSTSLLEGCVNSLSDPSCILTTMDMICSHQLSAFLPTFVTNDWLHMIRNVQDLETIDVPSSSTSTSFGRLREQMCHLKEQLSSLHQLVDNVHNLPFPSSIDSSALNDQCCLRTFCGHTSNSRFIPMLDSPSSSSWSSLDLDRTTPLATFNRTIPGFIRNPVSNFLMPTAPPARNEMTSSMVSVDDNPSSDDEQFSYNSKTGSVVVIRDDDLWIYPMGVDVKSKTFNSKEYHRSRSMFTSVHEHQDRNLFSRRKSFDDDEFTRNSSEILPAQLKKHKKGKG